MVVPAHAREKNRATPLADRRNGRGGADRVAPARTIFEIEFERLVIKSLEQNAQWRIVRERGTRKRAGLVAIVLERLEIEVALVANRRVEARPVHSGRGREVVKRCARIACFPETLGRARERDLRVIGAWPPPPLRLRLRCFLYHFANNP